MYTSHAPSPSWIVMLYCNQAKASHPLPLPHSLRQYKGSKDSVLDVTLVHDAVRILAASAEQLAGCGMDFAVLRSGVTCLIEVNDGVFTGHYEGLSGKDFTDMYVARWRQLLSTSPKLH